MSYELHNFQKGDTIFASDINEMDQQILENSLGYQKAIDGINQIIGTDTLESYASQTDTDEAYVKPTPMVVADIQKIEGKTVVWRQLLPEAQNYTLVSADANYRTHSIICPIGMKIIKGHKYLTSVTIKSVTGTPTVATPYQSDIYGYLNGKGQALFKAMLIKAEGLVTGRVRYVSSATEYDYEATTFSGKDGGLWLYDFLSTNEPAGMTVEYGDYSIVDLTELGLGDVGSGNVTNSTDERLQEVFRMADAVTGADTGSLLSAPVTGVTVRGRNLFDAKNGTKFGWNIEFDNPIKIPGSYTIYSLHKASYPADIPGYGITLNGIRPSGTGYNSFIEDGWGMTINVTNDMVGGKIVFQGKTAYASVEDVLAMGVMIVKGDALLDYKPYHEPVTHTIPASVISALPGYGWSAGNVANSIEQDANGNWEYVQRVGRFQLWDTVYSDNGAVGDIHKWYKSIPDRAITPNCISIFNPSTEVKDGNVVYRLNTNGVEFMSKKTTSAEFAASLVGQYLYYELATPIRKTISLPDFSPFTTEPGGTITFENEHKMSVKSTVVHSIDVMSTIQTKLDAKADKTALNSLAQEVQQNSDDIEDLQELYNDIANEYQTDDSDAYVKITPGHKAEIKSIGGKTAGIISQYIPYDLPFRGGVTNANGAHAVLKGAKIISGHKYYFGADWDRKDNSTFILGYRANGSHTDFRKLQDYSAQEYKIIFDANFNAESIGQVENNDTDHYVNGNWYIYEWRPDNSTSTMNNAMLIDLTLLYGAGHEPQTVSEFKADYPQRYFSATLPTVMSAPVTGVTVNGKNLLPQNAWHAGTVMQATGVGVNAQAPYGYGYTDYIKMSAGEYYFYQPNKTSSAAPVDLFTYCFCYNENYEFIGMTDKKYIQNSTFVIPDGTAYVRFRVYDNATTITLDATKLQPMAVVMGDHEVTEYIPHNSSVTYEIPESVRSQLNAYGCGIGDIHNTIERNALGQWEYVQRVGRIVFDGDTVKVTEADSNYSDTTTPYNYAYMGKSLFNSRYSQPMNGGKAISTIGEQKTSTAVKQSGGIVMSAVLSLGIKNVAVSGNTKAEYLQAFNDALNANPVDIVYEIATPVRTPIDLPNFGSFQTEPGGTMTFNNQFMMSVPSVVEHSGRNTIIQSPSGGDISFDGDITELVRGQIARLLQEGYIVKHETETRQVFGKNISAATTSLTEETFDIDTHEWSSVVILASYAGTGSTMTMTFSVGSTSYINTEGKTVTNVPYSSSPMGDGDGDNYEFICSKGRNLTITSAQAPFLDSMDKIKVHLNFSGDQFNNDWANVTVVLKR